VRRRAALRSSIAGVAIRVDGCLPSGGRARSESVSASCAMVGWALSIGLIDLPFSHWTHVTFKQPGGLAVLRVGSNRSAVSICLPRLRRAGASCSGRGSAPRRACGRRRAAAALQRPPCPGSRSGRVACSGASPGPERSRPARSDRDDQPPPAGGGGRPWPAAGLPPWAGGGRRAGRAAGPASGRERELLSAPRWGQPARARAALTGSPHGGPGTYSYEFPAREIRLPAPRPGPTRCGFPRKPARAAHDTAVSWPHTHCPSLRFRGYGWRPARPGRLSSGSVRLKKIRSGGWAWCGAWSVRGRVQHCPPPVRATPVAARC
jgi:hypothetical protein